MTTEDASRGNEIVQGLWIGASLSAMERLSIASFLSHGHEYHLYAYETVLNVPAGAVLRDAAEILPREKLFRYKEGGSWSGFSNFFRYKLLLDRGGWWFDTDFVCLKPLKFTDEHVFASEVATGVRSPTSGAIKSPRGSAAMAYAWDVCQQKDPTTLVWGETGPALVEKVVDKFQLNECVQDPATFCPLPYRAWSSVLDPDFDGGLIEGSSTIHLWHEMWRKARQDKDRHYHPSSLYERMRRKYLGDQDRISVEQVRSVMMGLRGMT